MLRINKPNGTKTDGTESKEEALITTGQRNTVTQESIDEALVKYLTDLNIQGKKNLEGILTSAKVELATDGTTVIVKIASVAAKKELDYHRSDIINRFRETLLNDDLILDCVIEQNKNENTTSKKIYTRKDKFEKLVSKNKHLEELKNKLGLDYDL